jgi:adenylate cyclase
MRRLLMSVVDAGVQPNTPPRRARFIRASNVVAVISGLWLLSVLPVFLSYWPAVRPLAISIVAGALAQFSVPFLNKAELFKIAQACQILSSFGGVTFNALHMGHDSWNDLFLIAIILVSFYYVEPLRILIGVTILGLVLFSGVELWYALGMRGLLEGHVQEGFFRTARDTSVYNIVLLTIGFSFYNRAILNSTQRALDREAARSESLLLNILPAVIAERLKQATDLIADPIPQSSILFADIVGFTEISREMDAAQLVGMLNEIFVGFDRAAKRLGLEKIKTIGDAYMVAAGLPEPRADHAYAAVEMAIAMQTHMQTIRVKHMGLRLRIGIHAGPVVAGVIGENKFAYDLWGDHVNVASRMESHGSPDRIHVTESFARAVADKWQFEERGQIEVKGHGAMRTFFLKQ